MKSALFIEKLGMTQIINESGDVEISTVLKVLDTEIIDCKTEDKHSYNAAVVAYSEILEKKLNNPKRGIFKKLNKSFKKYIKELRFDSHDYILDLDKKEFDNKRVSIDSFNIKDLVSLRGKTKGKGFQGTIKAHGFSRGPMTHGSKNHRLPGSIGAGTDPARVFKGTKMGKRSGDKNRTIKNLCIQKIDIEKNLIFIKGSVPGKNKSVLLLYK